MVMEKSISEGLRDTGIGKLLKMVSGILKGLRPLTIVLEKIMKLIMGILSPVLSAITILLMPILLMLKPIVRVLNQVMTPFIRLALQVMKAGFEKEKEGEGGAFAKAIASSMAIMFIGLSTAIVAAVKPLVDYVVISFTVLIGSFINTFIPFVKVNVERAVKSVQELSDKSFAYFSGVMIALSVKLAKPFISKTDDFVLSAASAILDIFVGGKKKKQSMADVISSGASIFGMDTSNLMQLWFGSPDGKEEGVLTKKSKSKIQELEKAGVAKVKEIIDIAREEAEKIKSRARISSGTSSFITEGIRGNKP